MTVVVHESPGELDLRALTLFGASAKPATTSPIGYFGTGLKYAVAVLVREGVPLRMFVGEDEYEFRLAEEAFRDRTFSVVKMRRRAGALRSWLSEVELPFTTELGRNWKPWQALRELHANALDEGGYSYRYSDEDAAAAGGIEGSLGATRFVVGPHDGYLEEFSRIGELFLPTAGRAWDGRTIAEAEKVPSRHVYWRGMRVMDLPEERPSLFRWNVLSPIELTEDRTAKYPFQLSAAVARHVLQSEDPHLVREVVAAPTSASWEGSLDYDFSGAAPGDVFRAVVQKRRYRGSAVGHSAARYYDRYVPPEPDEPWAAAAARHIRADDWSAAEEVLREHRAELATLLEEYLQAQADAAEPALRVPEVVLVDRDTGEEAVF